MAAQRPVEISSPSQAIKECEVKIVSLYLALTGTLAIAAAPPGGRAVNLGEVVLKNGAGEVKAISDMQTFGMIVTAEPYFAVTQPGNTVVLENVFGPATLGKDENIDASYELIGRGSYSS